MQPNERCQIQPIDSQQAMNTHEIQEKNGLPTFKFVEQRVNIHNLLYKKAEQNGLVAHIDETERKPWASTQMFDFNKYAEIITESAADVCEEPSNSSN